MNRKFLPLLIFSFVVLGVLAIQLSGDVFRTNAGILKIEDARKTHYEKIYQNLSLDLSTGEKVELKKINEPLVLVSFWASWCLPCVKEFKGIAELQKSFSKNELKVIGINCDATDPEKNLKKTEKKYSLTFKSALDPKNKYLDKFTLTHIPATVIYHKGQVVYYSDRYTDFSDPKLVSNLKSILK